MNALKTRQSSIQIPINCSRMASKSYPCPYFEPMVPMDDQPPIWSISSNGHPEALRRSLNVCRKLWAVSPKSFFNHLPSAFEACVARQVPSFRYRGYRYLSFACSSASSIATLTYPTKGNVRSLLLVLSLLIELGLMLSNVSAFGTDLTIWSRRISAYYQSYRRDI